MKKARKGRRNVSKKSRKRKPSAAPARRTVDISPLLDAAARALDGGQPQAALASCQQAMAADTTHPDALNLCGIALYQLDDWAQARTLFEQAIEHRPDFVHAYVNLGNVLRSLGDMAASEEAYAHALELEPGNRDALFNLGIAFEATGRFNQAEAHYRRCLAGSPYFVPARFNLGNVYRAQGRLDAAEAAFSQVLEADPTHAEAHNNLGTVAQEQRRDEDAERHFRNAVKSAPDFAEAHYNLGIALQENGKNNDAIASYEDALNADPTHAGAQVNIGYALQSLERFDEAEAAYRKAIAMAPAYDKVRVNLGDLYLRRGEINGAIEEMESYLADHPGNTSALAFQAMALTEAGRNKEAETLLDFDRLLRPQMIDVPGEYGSLTDFNTALADHVLAHPSLIEAPASHATRNGRHSGELLTEPLGPMQAFEAVIRSSVEGYREERPADPDHPFLARRPKNLGLNVWGVAMESAGHQVAHIHPASWLSGVYYVRLPEAVRNDDPDHAGWIEFGRPPRDFHVTAPPPLKLVRPEEGLMILFPSYMYHRTIPFHSDELRISIAFDVLDADEF